MGFFENLFGGRRDRSASVAKQRLMMVLVDDRYKLTPETLEQMKVEIARCSHAISPLLTPSRSRSRSSAARSTITSRPIFRSSAASQMWGEWGNGIPHPPARQGRTVGETGFPHPLPAG